MIEANPRDKGGRLNGRLARFAPSTICALTIAALSLTPNPRETRMVGFLEVVGGELWAHGLAWGVLGLTTRWSRATPRGSWRISALAWCLCVGYGVLMEGLQILVPGRGAQLADLLADAAGATVGILLMDMWMNRSRDHEQA